MLSKQATYTLLLLLVLLVSAAVYTYATRMAYDRANSDAAKTLGTNDLATYTGLNGDEVTLDAFDDQIRVVNSWASWAPDSRRELQDLERLAEVYQDEGVVVVAINRNEDPIRAKRFIDQLGELAHIHFLLDVDDAFYGRMDGKAMPETLFFDRNGNIIHHARGVLSYEAMEQYVEAAITASE